MTEASKRVLVAIPAFNEAGTIAAVVKSIRATLPGYDLLVINDGSGDATGKILTTLDTTVATHLCNLGYGRAIQTAIMYAIESQYDALVTLDADGQHHPDQIAGLMQEFDNGGWDVLIGSRYVGERGYQDAPLGRRIGMQVFSMLVRMVIGQRVFDTSSGMKVMRRTVFDSLTHWHFVDFHAEAIVYLMRLGYRIGEFPVTVAERTQGTSMYTPLSYFKYPLKTSMLVLLGIIEAAITRRRHRS